MTEQEILAAKEEDKLPALESPLDWFKIMVVCAGVVAVNVVAFFVSFGAGVIVTLPLSLFLAFLLIRNMMPRHRFPQGRSRG